MFKKSKIILSNGEFALYNGVEYLLETYLDHVLLYQKDDIEKVNAVHKVSKNELDGYINYRSRCEMDNILYTATKIIDDKFCEILSCYTFEPKLIKIKDTTAIWTQKGKETNIYYIKNKQAISDIVEAKHLFGLDYNDYTKNKHLSFGGDFNYLANLQTSIKKLYNSRVVADELTLDFNSADGSWDCECYSRLSIDDVEFHLDLDNWGIVFLIPYNKNDAKANAFMVEILKYIRKNGLG